MIIRAQWVNSNIPGHLTNGNIYTAIGMTSGDGLIVIDDSNQPYASGNSIASSAAWTLVSASEAGQVDIYP